MCAAMANSSRISELDELRLVEERLLKEREEVSFSNDEMYYASCVKRLCMQCERLEAQIRLLAGGNLSTSAISGLSAPLPPPPPPPPGLPPPPQTAPKQPVASPIASPVNQFPAAAEQTAIVRRVEGSTSAAKSQLIAPAESTRSAVNRAMSPASAAGVSYRSPMYRSASPSRRLGQEKVITSNFGRSPRFRDEKGWVPGPGKYQANTTDFSPITVSKPQAVQSDINLGHTWQGKQSAAHHHEAAMIAAAARLKPTDIVPAPAESPAAESDAGELRVALEGALRRERTLRKEIETMQKHLESQRVATAAIGGTLRHEAETMAAELINKTTALDTLASKISYIDVDFHKVDETYTEVQNSINDLGASLAGATEKDGDATVALQRVLAKFPALAKLVERAKQLDDHLQSLHASVESAKAQTSRPKGPSPMTSPTATSKSYSSLTKALAKQTAIGTLGESGEFIETQGFKSPSPDRSLHRNGVAGPSNVALRTIDETSSVTSFSRGRGKGDLEAAKSLASFMMPQQPGGKSVSPRASSRSPPSNRSVPLTAAVTAARGVLPGNTSPSGLTNGGVSPAKGVAATAPILKRMSMGIAQLPSVLPAPAPIKETTVNETLQQIFRYYSLFGDRESDGLALKSQQYYKLIRDSGLLNNDTKISPADVDMAFTRAAAQGARTGPSTRLRFEPFIGSLNELAIRAFRGDNAAAAANKSDPEAFKQLLQEYILTIYPKLKTDALFVVDVAQVGAEETAAKFASEFTRPDVLTFFNEHRAALQSIYFSYATDDRRGLDGQPPSTYGVVPAAARMNKKALLQFASDFKIIPDMMSRPDLLSLAREAARAIGRESSEDLSYPEWIELLAMTAYVLGDSSLSESRMSLIGATAGPKEKTAGTQHLPLLTKIHVLLYNMYDKGARFNGDGLKMIRAVSHVVRAEYDAASKAADSAARTTTDEHQRKVKDVLTENIFV